jgi:dihydroorotate dehydrogenase
MDPERAHDLTMAALRHPLTLRVLPRAATRPALHQTVMGLSFANPLGLGAGLDKQGTAVPAWGAIGFGFAEIGTVTPAPQPGNPKPRLFRLPADLAVINRFGFNSEGAAAVAGHLQDRPAPEAMRLGINVGKNKDTPIDRAVDDYLRAIEVLHPVADYFVVNVSSPNTAGLRTLQQEHTIRLLMEQAVAAVRRLSSKWIPVLVKLSPDVAAAQLLQSATAAIEGGASGLIATNTTTSRGRLKAPASLAGEAGGLSGAPLRVMANDTCRLLFKHLGPQVPIVGVGGISNADHAWERIRSGASLLQVYTGLIYEGPGLVSGIVKGLAARMARDGFTRIGEAVGIDVR